MQKQTALAITEAIGKFARERASRSAERQLTAASGDTAIHQGREFHITVGTAPKMHPSNGQDTRVELLHELQLVKAAVFYADRVTLCSPAASMVIDAFDVGTYTMSERLELLKRVGPMVQPNGRTELGVDRYRALMKKKHRTRDELLLLRRFESEFERHWDELTAVVGNLAERAGALGIVEAMRSGVLQLDPLHAGDGTDALIAEFLETVGDAIRSNRTHPLFDDETGNLVRLAIETGKLTVSSAGVSRGKHSGLAASLLERLPLFEAASLDELLSVRRDLERPLIRFRGAVLAFSEKIRTAPWDADFESEADLTFRRDVEPAVMDVEDALRSSHFLIELGRKAMDTSVVLKPGSVLAVAVSTLSGLPHIASVALGATLAMGNAAYDAWLARAQRLKAAEQNRMYFYYRAKQALQD